MAVNVPYLLLGLLLLWFPRRWMRFRVGSFGKKKSRSRASTAPAAREPGDPRFRFWREMKNLRNHFDLLRALAGGLALAGGREIAPALAAAEGSEGRALLWPKVIILAIIAVGMVIQTIRKDRGKVTYFPPVFYAAGLTFALCDVWAALFSFALIWALNPLIGNAQGFLTVYAALVMTFELSLTGLAPHSLGAPALVFLPVLLSLLTRRPLVVLSKKRPLSADSV